MDGDETVSSSPSDQITEGEFSSSKTQSKFEVAAAPADIHLDIRANGIAFRQSQMHTLPAGRSAHLPDRFKRELFFLNLVKCRLRLPLAAPKRFCHVQLIANSRLCSTHSARSQRQQRRIQFGLFFCFGWKLICIVRLSSNRIAAPFNCH